MEQEPFYASMKMITGEEVLAEVMPVEESNNSSFFIVTNPIVVQEQHIIDHKRGMMAQTLSSRKWMVYGSEDTTIVNKNHVVSISEMDKFGINFYSHALNAAKIATPIQRKIDSEDNSGYIGTVEDERDRLKKLFENS
jgi:hypothetical protein